MTNVTLPSTLNETQQKDLQQIIKDAQEADYTLIAFSADVGLRILTERLFIEFLEGASLADIKEVHGKYLATEDIIKEKMYIARIIRSRDAEMHITNDNLKILTGQKDGEPLDENKKITKENIYNFVESLFEPNRENGRIFPISERISADSIAEYKKSQDYLTKEFDNYENAVKQLIASNELDSQQTKELEFYLQEFSAFRNGSAITYPNFPAILLKKGITEPDYQGIEEHPIARYVSEINKSIRGIARNRAMGDREITGKIPGYFFKLNESGIKSADATIHKITAKGGSNFYLENGLPSIGDAARNKIVAGDFETLERSIYHAKLLAKDHGNLAIHETRSPIMTAAGSISIKHIMKLQLKDGKEFLGEIFYTEAKQLEAEKFVHSIYESIRFITERSDDKSIKEGITQGNALSFVRQYNKIVGLIEHNGNRLLNKRNYDDLKDKLSKQYNDPEALNPIIERYAEDIFATEAEFEPEKEISKAGLRRIGKMKNELMALHRLINGVVAKSSISNCDKDISALYAALYENLPSEDLKAEFFDFHMPKQGEDYEPENMQRVATMIERHFPKEIEPQINGRGI